MMQNLPLEMKLHNMVQQCQKCRKWKNLKGSKKETMYAVSTIGGAQQTAPGVMALVTSMVVICKECFEELECTERDSGLVIASAPLTDISKLTRKDL